jgi:Ca2+/Na+ antiporter
MEEKKTDMRKIVSSATVICLGVIAFLVSWDKFVDTFNIIGQLQKSRGWTYFAIVRQALFYFIVSSIIFVFGLLVLLKKEGQKFKIIRATFFALVTIWFVLEIPIYKCDFYEINHSFWESKKGHFH